MATPLPGFSSTPVAVPAPARFAEGRDFIVDYLRRELTGPVGGQTEELDGEDPHKRYTLGVLFPQDTISDKELAEEQTEEQNASGDELLADDPVTLAGQWMPSSIGLSFYFTGPPLIDIYLEAAAYAKAQGGPWTRRPLAEESSPEKVTVTPDGAERRTRLLVLEERGELHLHWRRLGEGYLVTVTLANACRLSEQKKTGGDHCLYQVRLRCRTPHGSIREYPSVNSITADQEEQELQLLYRRQKVYAIGHGCAPGWDASAEQPDELSTEVMPLAYVPAMTHDLADSPPILTVARLANPDISRSTLIQELKAFIAGYGLWIDGLEADHPDVSPRLQPAKGRILARLSIALQRMESGIVHLEQNDTAWEAFQLANLAMLMQMRHGELAEVRRRRNEVRPEPQDYLGLTFKWRPFQLAFQLLSVEPMDNAESSAREVVDLIWFPTGGGKTEAYLAVAAYEIFRRRLVHGVQGGGTVVITRYTLRLLTAQQFERAARLISACELLRRADPVRLGEKPVSIGFWAGQSASPNSYADAVTHYEDLRERMQPAENHKFQLSTCPWCGTELLPETREDDAAAYGFSCGNASFKVFCPSDACAFHEHIPVSVVDEDLYAHPPTFLIATVDKFARLAWVEGAGSFFGRGTSLPPSLIIQDELHLLSGPLGTTVGLYESAFEALMAYHGAKPKIIASTATIRSAGEQVRGLFGRPVALFPPAGLTADDSFFARVDKKQKGRLYAGIMSSNHRATTSVVRTAAALQQAVVEGNDVLSESEKNAYWTLVLYHLSLRELGKTISFAHDDIPARIKVIASTEDRARTIYDDDVLELTSNMPPAQIPASLARMALRYTADGAVSIVASTNMFSVGVDVKRLGLMMVNGQPKTTSEYIQASSRVGRDKVPGLVVTHYSASKPRDRSHYESFQPYHASLYRFVEPTSVTPFSLPARNRALHAALVIMVRHGIGWGSNEAAELFDKADPAVSRAVDFLVRQAEAKDESEAAATRIHLNRLVDEWHVLATRARAKNITLRYKGSNPVVPLLRNFGEEGAGWPTLQSMRNVDAECAVAVLGEKFK